MPITVKGEEEDERFTRFIYKPRWFVLAQTEGEPITPPEIPAWSKERTLEALDIAETPFDLMSGNTQGYARQRSISVSPLAALPHKTTFHELAHVLLGHTSEADFNDGEATPRSLREVEAECIALICCETLGLDGADYCRGYVQNWNRSGEAIPEHSAQKIFHAADQILRAGRPADEQRAEVN